MEGYNLVIFNKFKKYQYQAEPITAFSTSKSRVSPPPPPLRPERGQASLLEGNRGRLRPD